MSPAELLQNGWGLVSVYLDTMEKSMGSESPFGREMTDGRGFAVSWIAAYGILDENTAERALRDLSEKLEVSDPKSSDTMEAKLRLGNFLLDRRRCDEARVVATDIIATEGSEAHAYVVDDCYRILFWIARMNGFEEEAFTAGLRWVDFCKTRLGLSHELTVDALGEVMVYLQAIGQVEIASGIQEDHKTAMGELCRRLERSGIEEPNEAKSKLYGRTLQTA